ncbi:hypothetical protein FACS1894147_03740 [Spirochaetia bacterium]|nr:hypothetical protein FACS1894147_03740 [Spirochaetia bacterium]
MGQFGEVAIKAVKLIQSGAVKDPCTAWEHSVGCLVHSASSEEKGCPKDAFLGLCSARLVKGIPPGTYTGSVKNSMYATSAVALLKASLPLPTNEPSELWRLTLSSIGEDVNKTHNSQMDVVLALWNNGWIL